MWRQAIKKGLVKAGVAKENQFEEYTYIMRFVGLALIPPDKTDVIYEDLKGEILQLDKKKKPWAEYLKYFEKIWLNGYGSVKFSAYNEENRTNNKIESYHRKINRFLTGTAMTIDGFLRK